MIIKSECLNCKHTNDIELINIVSLLPRKIITASITSTLFSIIFVLVNFKAYIDKEYFEYLYLVGSVIPTYMIYIVPVIFIYGIFTSILSDKIGDLVTRKITYNNLNYIVSGISHCIFGLILLLVSLPAAILFFVTDLLLSICNYKYKWLDSIKSLIIPISVWLLLMGVVWFENF